MSSPDTPHRVQHPLHGEGSVRAWRRGGRVALVVFDDDPFPLEVPARELGEASTRPHPTTSPRLEGSIEQVRAALTLEAMRLGVVPSADLSAYTVGRGALMQQIERDLEVTRSAGGAARAVLGDYGSGKTHLIELIQQTALRQGFLSARVVLDPEETSPAHPKRVYRALLRQLRYPESMWEEGAGLRPLFDAAISRPEVCARFCPEAPQTDTPHLYLSPALAYWRTLHAPGVEKKIRGVSPADAPVYLERAKSLLLDWLEGHPTISNKHINAHLSRLPGKHPKLYSLLDYRPWARIYGYLLSGIAALTSACGYEGLSVSLDEAEFYALLSSENKTYADALFSAWCHAASGVALDDDALGVGGYGVQRTLPPRFSDAPNLYLVLAMTPNRDGLDMLGSLFPPEQQSNIQPLGRDEYLSLSHKVSDFYASAHPEWALPERLVQPLGKVLHGLIDAGYVGSPRQAMKFIIEFLDIVRYKPAQVGAMVQSLQSSLYF